MPVYFKELKPIFVGMLCILLFSFLVGCSQNVSPLSEQLQDTKLISNGNLAGQTDRYLLAYFRLYPDPENLRIDVEPLRHPAGHFNVKSFLLPPNCNGCIEFIVHSFNPTTRIMDVDVTLKNPTFLVGYDVRGILIANNTGHEMTNADDWTKLFDDSNPADINPFKAFDVDDAERKFNFYETDTRKVLFKLPKPPNWGGFDYAVDASWPGHCREPYEIVGFVQDGTIAKLFDAANLSVVVHDWQNDVTEVTIDATPIMGEVINLSSTTGDTWSGEIVNTLLPNPGVCRLLVSAYSPNNPGWWLYDYVDVVVSVPVYQDRITFTSDRNGNWDIFLVNPDGTGLEQLTIEDSNDEAPDFSPTERKIIFVSDRDAHQGAPPNNVLNELYVYDIDSGGTAKKSVVCQALYPDWSPPDMIPGSSYALFITSYLECLPSDAEKYIGYIDLDTAEVDYLPTGYLTQYRTDPEFSPDGSKVIFTEFALGNSKVHEYDFPSGDNEVTLTDFGMEFDCTYSPDGSMVAYASTRKNNTDIFTMNLDSHVETRVTDSIETDKQPAFSPDGQRIAFVSYRDSGVYADIYVTNLTGDYFFNITNTPTSDDLSPSWSNNIF